MRFFSILLFLIMAFFTQFSFAVNIEKQGDHYTAKIVRDGQPLYFNLIKITDENFDFWKIYALKARHMSAYFYRLYQDVARCKALVKMHRNIFETEAQEQDFITRIAAHKINCMKALDALSPEDSENEYRKIEYKLNWQIYSNGIVNGIAGMDNVLKTPTIEGKEVFIVCITKVPLSDINQNLIGLHACFDINWYMKTYGDIFMSMMVIHNPKAPISTHFGIFRNPLSFHRQFMGEEDHAKGMSMALHGFAAMVEDDYFHEKKYMITWPMRSMHDIFEKNIAPGYLHIGTNISFVRSRWNPENKSLPLIFEACPQERGIITLAKEGVDIRKKENLDESEIFFSSSDITDFSDFTPLSKRILVNLEGLIPYFSCHVFEVGDR